MVIGGMTQYLTKAQGMPIDIEKRLTKKIRTFIWNNDSTPPVGLETLNLPSNMGGKKLLNLSARNKAIHLTWLKSYLQLENNRPAWAYIADVLINQNIPATQGPIDHKSKINTYLQTWNPKTNANTGLPKDLAEMLQTGKEFNVRFDALTIPTKHKAQ